MKEKTLLVITPGTDFIPDPYGQGYFLVVARTGECLASHICSDASFAKADLYENRSDRKKDIKKKFGEVEIKFIDETDIPPKELKDRNIKWAYNLKP